MFSPGQDEGFPWIFSGGTHAKSNGVRRIGLRYSNANLGAVFKLVQSSGRLKAPYFCKELRSRTKTRGLQLKTRALIFHIW